MKHQILATILLLCTVAYSSLNAQEIDWLLSGHTELVNTIDWSPDGRYIVSGAGTDRFLKLWDANTGRLIRIFSRPESEVHEVGFSTDGRIIAAACNDKTVKLWDVDNGRLLRSLFTSSFAQPTSIAFSSDGFTIAAGMADGTIVLWDISSGDTIALLHSHQNGVNDLAFAPDGRLLASAGNDGHVRMWNRSTLKIIQDIPANGMADAVAFSHSGAFIAFGGAEKISVREVSSGNEVMAQPLDGGQFRQLKFVPGDSLIVYSYLTLRTRPPFKWHIMITSLNNATIVNTLPGSAFALPPAGRNIATADELLSITSIDTDTTSAPPVPLTRHYGSQIPFGLSSTGDTIAVADLSLHGLKFYITSTASNIFSNNETAWIPRVVAYSPEGSALANGGGLGTGDLTLLDMYFGYPRYSGSTHADVQHHAPVSSLAFAPTGWNIASGSPDSTVRLWLDGNFFAARILSKGWAEIQLDSVTTVAWSPNGQHVTAGCRNGSILVWDTASPVARYGYIADSPVNGIAYTIDGSALFAALDNGSILRLTDDGSSLQMVAPLLRGHTDVVTSLAVSKDGKFLISGSLDGTVRVWSIPTGSLLHTFDEYQGDPGAPIGHLYVTISPNNRYVYSSTTDATLIRWRSQFLLSTPDNLPILAKEGISVHVTENDLQIHLSVPCLSDVLITMSDILGREQNLILQDRYEAGEHIIHWNTEQYPSGTYILELRRNGTAISRMVTIVR